MTRASGIGSLPGTSAREATRMVRDLLVDGDRLGIPFLPELPARGPGADMIGRAAGLLVEMPVDLQPAGWRLVDHPGRDLRRTQAIWREDLDELAEAYDGYTGPLKIQVVGPWTLAATLELTRGERVLVDPGATRDLTASLAEGIAVHVSDVQRLVPGAEVIVQLDEPALPAVLAGELPTASGYGRVRAVDEQRVAEGLRTVLAKVPGANVIHCCHQRIPLRLLASTGVGAISLDLTLASARQWEVLGELISDGVDVFAGVLPTDDAGLAQLTVAQVADAVVRPWERVGLEAAALSQVTITPACGLAALTQSGVANVLRMARDTARELTEKEDR